MQWGCVEWNATYTELPNRQLKVKVLQQFRQLLLKLSRPDCVDIRYVHVQALHPFLCTVVETNWAVRVIVVYSLFTGEGQSSSWDRWLWETMCLSGRITEWDRQIGGTISQRKIFCKVLSSSFLLHLSSCNNSNTFLWLQTLWYWGCSQSVCWGWNTGNFH